MHTQRIMFNFETPGQQIARRTKKFFLQKYSSLDKPMCKRASCNWFCYITRLYTNCHRLLTNYLLLLWTVVLFGCVICAYFHALRYYCLLPHAVNCGRFCFWRCQSLALLFMYEISREPVNGFAPNSHGGRVWFLARTSLKIKVKGQGHQGQTTAFFGPFGGLRAVCVW